MKINIHAAFQPSGYNINLINLRVEKLEKYFNRIIATDVYLKTKYGSNAVNDWEVEIKMKVPTKILVAKGHADSFEKALPLAVEKMRKQLEKLKKSLSPYS